jgi:hypothetical protein
VHIPQTCGIPSLLEQLASGDDVDAAVAHIVTLPYVSATGSCTPSIFLCCCAPAGRTAGSAAALRARLLDAGVLPAAVKCVTAQGDGLDGGLIVLEQFVPFDPAGALAAGALPVLKQALAAFLLEGEAVPQPGVPFDASLLAGRILLLELAAASLATLAASPASGLSAAERLTLAASVAAAVAPAAQFLNVLDGLSKVIHRHNMVCALTAAVMAGGGAPVALELTNPKDVEINIPCGPTLRVNAAPEGAFADRVAALSMVISTHPPVRIGLATTGAVSVAPPVPQVMTTPEYAPPPPAVYLAPAPAPAAAVPAAAVSLAAPAPATAAVSVAPGTPSAVLVAWCTEHELVSVAALLHDAGVTEPADLKFLSDADVDAMKLPPVGRNKLKHLKKAFS